MTEAQKTRSPEQLAILAQARVKAQAVRSENAKLKSQERELEKLEKQQEKENRKKNVTERMAKLKGTVETEPEHEPVEEEEEPLPKPIKKPIKKKPKQKIVEVSDSDSEEEEQIVYIKKSKPKKVVYREERPVPAEPPKPVYRHIRAEHADLYKRMFTI